MQQTTNDRYAGKVATLRAWVILVSFLGLTLPLMPVQALLLRISPRYARTFPNWYHRQVCRIVGVRLKITGEVATDHPVLLIANHTSWLDIPVLSAVAPVSFIAKREVGSWPLVAQLARLQQSVFVDRDKRKSAAKTAQEITGRLERGDTLVLFAEGTSSDGNRVLPFMTSLFAAAKPPNRRSSKEKQGSKRINSGPGAVAQTLSMVYTHLHGIPLGRADRSMVGWYGDMEMQSHAWQLFKAGPLDVHIHISPPISLDDFTDRKDLARKSESRVRERVVRILRNMPESREFEITNPPAAVARPAPAQSDGPARKWV